MTLRKVLITAIIVLSVILCTMITGTLSWLTDQTGELKNEFEPSDINITLTESASDFKMVPGGTIVKDPMITVKAGSEACYVFVKVTENLGAWDDNATDDEFKTYLDYTIAAGWNQLVDANGNSVKGVYYRIVNSSDEDQKFYLLAGNEAHPNGMILVDGGKVTKEMMKELYDDEGEVDVDKLPTLTFAASAIQLANLPDQNGDSTVDAIDAWTLLNTTP